MLYLPGNNPNMLTRGYLFGSDGIILDLEDAVAMVEKTRRAYSSPNTSNRENSETATSQSASTA